MPETQNFLDLVAKYQKEQKNQNSGIIQGRKNLDILISQMVEGVTTKEGEKGVEVVGARPQMGFIDGITKSSRNGLFVGGVLLSTFATSAISSYDAEGYYFLLCPAGTFTVTVEKPGWQTQQKNINMPEAGRLEETWSLTPANIYTNSYFTVTWPEIGSQHHFKMTLCDTNGVPLSGFENVRENDNFFSWSPKNYINLVLGIPDSQLSGFTFMWKATAANGQTSSQHQGIVTVP